MEDKNTRQRIEDHVHKAKSLLDEFMGIKGISVRDHIKVLEHCYQANCEFERIVGDLSGEERDLLESRLTALARMYDVVKDYQRIHIIGSMTK